jgi:hypothetical protein
MKTSLSASVYHSILRIGLVVNTLLLLFVGGYVYEPTSAISYDTGIFVASVIASPVKKVNIPENNGIVQTATISNSYEKGIPPQSTDRSVFILTTIIFVFLLAIILNYIIAFGRQQLHDL